MHLVNSCDRKKTSKSIQLIANNETRLVDCRSFQNE